jgi:hypothetical protein
MVAQVEEEDGRIALARCIAIILLAIHRVRGGLIMAEVLVRDLDASVVEKLKARAGCPYPTAHRCARPNR